VLRAGALRPRQAPRRSGGMDEHPNAKLVREMIDDPVNTEVVFGS
jgi:hypothetical protein